MVIDGKMTLGQLVTFNALLSYFTTPLQSIIGLQTKLQAAKVANNRLNEVYSVDSEFTKVSAFNERPKALINSGITLTNVKFRYGFGNYALDDISINIKAGAKVALVNLP